MNNRVYLVTVTISSSDSEVRNLTPYDNQDTAIRKFHEIFNTVGAGSKKVSAVLLDSNLYPIKSDNWEHIEPEPVPTPEETPTE